MIFNFVVFAGFCVQRVCVGLLGLPFFTACRATVVMGLCEVS